MRPTRQVLGLTLLLGASTGCGSRTGVLTFDAPDSDPVQSPATGGKSAGPTPSPKPPPKPTPTPVPAMRPLQVLSLGTGGTHSCTVIVGGRLKCWGAHSFGAIGLEDLESRGDEPGELGNNLPFVQLGKGLVVQEIVPSRDAHTCAIFTGGLVKCWGDNDYGQLGIEEQLDRGTHPGEMGDALPFVNLGKGRSAQSLAAGSNHTCAVLDDQSVKCWGDNQNQQLGDGRFTRGAFAGEMGDNLLPLGLPAVRQLAAGSMHTCALINDGSVQCWGWERGAEDPPIPANHPATIVNFGASLSAFHMAAGGRHTCAALSDDTVRCWAVTQHADQPADPYVTVQFEGDVAPALRLGVGGDRGCALFGDGSVQCWSLAESDEKEPPATRVQFGAGRSAIQLAAAGSRVSRHGCALLDDGSVKCWGDNNRGQLGAGDTAPRSGTDELVAVDLGTE